LKHRPRIIFLNVIAGVFKQVAVFDAAWAGVFAGAAAEAKVDVVHGGGVHWQPP